MRRAPSFFAAVTTVLCLLIVVACGDDEPTRSGGAARPAALDEEDGGTGNDPGGTSEDGGDEADDGATVDVTLDAAWWKRTPPARLVLSGGQQGALRPTAHTKPATGGLERTAAVLYRLRQVGERLGTKVGALSLGWSMRGDLEPQDNARADYVRAFHEALDYDAALLGGTDLVVPSMAQPRGPGPETPTPPVNVKLANTSPAAGAMRLYEEFTVGPVTLRALCAIDPAEAQPLADAGLVDAVSSPAQTMAGLRPKTEAVWVLGTRLLGKGTREELVGSLGRLGPGVVVDIGGSDLGASTLDRVPLRADGDPLVVALPPHGTGIGVLDFEPAGEGSGWLVSYRQILLVPTWEKYGGPALEAVKHLAGLYRGLLRERRYLHDFQRVARLDAQYVGSSACAECHAAIYNDWRTSRHATALNSLRGVGHAWDPACLRCHVVGWDRGKDGTWTGWKSGFRDPEKTPFMGGVGCENCHGPGSAHVAAPHDRSLFGPDGPNRRSMGQEACMRCHDAENSHGFAAGYERVHLPAVDHRKVPSDRRTVLPEGK